MEESKGNNLFLERVKDSNVFTEEEINIIFANQNLYEKCYYVGIIDAKF